MRVIPSWQMQTDAEKGRKNGVFLVRHALSRREEGLHQEGVTVLI